MTKEEAKELVESLRKPQKYESWAKRPHLEELGSEAVDDMQEKIRRLRNDLGESGEYRTETHAENFVKVTAVLGYFKNSIKNGTTEDVPATLKAIDMLISLRSKIEAGEFDRKNITQKNIFREALATVVNGGLYSRGNLIIDVKDPELMGHTFRITTKSGEVIGVDVFEFWNWDREMKRKAAELIKYKWPQTWNTIFALKK